MQRLFKDDDGEILNDLGQLVASTFHEIFKPHVRDAVNCNMSLRDLQTIIIEELITLCAEERLLRGVRERKKKRTITPS